MTEIEQIKTERDQAIAAALKLRDAVAEHIGAETYPNEIALAVKDVESIAPKRKPLECWVNIYNTENPLRRFGRAWSNQCDAEQAASTRQDVAILAVHMREVLPVKWGRWESVKSNGRWWVANSTGELIGATESRLAADWISDAHNAEMERLEGGEDE